MPHFVVECSRSILQYQPEEAILQRLHEAAVASGLFDEHDIKVRVHPYAVQSVGGSARDFIHVFASIMEGRSVAQRADLSRRLVETLVAMFPQVAYIAANISEFEKATYCNRAMLGS
ncbi:5-carboxymethyl-2-hydroxymuconate Delta-isomerase [Lysobacter yangpyeongensis]|jgi:5-carboxymethyl-2-hydroxymuconate isomerase|uniref:5-carboxymethyl-2-hydroxymuconate Delta-isomerase n=1 Tax=Lysobacter yangpyeongensis TaxID=346182 RepID=A0ABW0SIG1_9GAMM